MPTLESLIQTFEGFGTAAATSINAGNNPGAIMGGPAANNLGATGTAANGTAIFPDLQTGYAALQSVEAAIIGGGNNTPASFVGVYEGVGPDGAQAPGNTLESTTNYARFIADGLGIGVNDAIPQSALSGTTAGGSTATAATPNTAANILNPFSPNVGNSTPGATTTAQTIAGGTAGTGSLNSALSAVTGFFTGLSGISISQVVAVIVGAGLIIGGIFFLRPVQQTATKIVKAVSA